MKTRAKGSHQIENFSVLICCVKNGLPLAIHFYLWYAMNNLKKILAEGRFLLSLFILQTVYSVLKRRKKKPWGNPNSTSVRIGRSCSGNISHLAYLRPRRIFRKNGVLSGPIFQTREGRSMHVTAATRSLCEEAKMPWEKGNPKCLRKLYLSNKAGVECNISLLVEQAMERMMEQEQFTIGWDE